MEETASYHSFDDPLGKGAELKADVLLRPAELPAYGLGLGTRPDNVIQHSRTPFIFPV